MNCLLLSIVLLTIIGQVFGRIVNFSLLTFGGSATVTVEGKQLVMKRVDNYSSVYSVSAMVSDEELEYTYTVDNTPEGFTRTLPPKVLTTHIEFYGRKETLSPLKGMGYPEDKPRWSRSIGKTALFDDSYIPTVIFDSGSRDFFVSGNDTYTLGRFTIVLQDEIFTEENIETKAQNRYQDKFQFRIKLQNKIHKRRIFKFRSNPTDPAFFRQSLYGDLAAAVGNPVHNQIVVRVYLSDGTPIGLYLMIEVTSSKSFIKTQFYGNEITGKLNAPEKLGTALDCSTGADFREGQSISAFQYSEEKGESNEKIRDLIEAMHDLDVHDQAEVQKFSKEWFDLDVFLRALALEYLTGDWDSYWMLTSNFVMYDDPLESTKHTTKFYFIDQDFDLTFGIGLDNKVNTVGREFPEQSYKTLVDREWNIDNNDGPNREAVDLFLRGGVTTEMFENHLIDIVKHAFNPVACGRRLDEYVRRYADEIDWDYHIDRLHIADPTVTLKRRYVWTVSDFYENMDDTPKESTPWGLKEWIKLRATAVADEFGFEWDSVPLDPVLPIIQTNNDTFELVGKKDEKSGGSTISIKGSFMIILFTFVLGYLF